MDIKKELNSMRFLNFALKTKARQLEELKCLKSAIKSPVITGMPKATGFDANNKLDNILDKISSLEETQQSDIDSLITKKSKWIKEFKKLPIDESVVLELRYFEGLKWCEIAEELNYEERAVYNLHGKALLNLKKVVNL